jgi:hypothetical protein
LSEGVTPLFYKQGKIPMTTQEPEVKISRSEDGEISSQRIMPKKKVEVKEVVLDEPERVKRPYHLIW